MKCKVCGKDKSEKNFRANRYGLVQTCNDCRKPKTVKVKKSLTDYKAPNGQGGKWVFNFDKLNLNTPEANYIYGLIAVLGKNNPNVARRNRKNIMFVGSKKKTIQLIAEFLEMDSKAVYEMPRAEELKLPPKWGLILYHDNILDQFSKLSSLRREDYRRGKLEGEKAL